MGDPDPDQGSQGINAPDQVGLAEFFHDIQALLILGTPKKKGFSSLGRSRRKLHTRPWCNGLKTIWCLYSLSSIVIVNSS